MPTGSSTSAYALGSTDGEHERLIRQAEIFDPFTERLFRDAGVGPGQCVLDIGSGLGDVSMLAARLVGPSGIVIGVDRDPSIVAKAEARVADAGLRNVTFTLSEVGQSHMRPMNGRTGPRSFTGRIGAAWLLACSG